MLNKWVQWTPETHGKYATLQDLVNALRSKTVGLGAVAEEVQTEFSGNAGNYKMDQYQPASSMISSYRHSERSECETPKVASELIPPGPSASPFEHYAYYLQSYFTRRRQPADKWPGIEIDDYIRLAVVSSKYLIHVDHEEFRKAAVRGSIDTILEAKSPVHFSDLLQPNFINGKRHALKQLLIEGAPGIGKSTMSWEVCRKWGNGELFQEYSLVVMLRFRDSWVQQIKSVSDLFRFPGEPEMQREVAKQIKQSQGKGLLLILEGYDEAPPSLRKADSLFYDLFTGVLLPNAMVMVTTRPNASSELRRECKGESSRIVEVLGFGEKEIEEYVQSRFNEKKELENFRKYLELHPHIYSMMYVPLNSAIVTRLYQSSKANSTIVPQTMTQLYTAIIKTLLLRYMKEFPEYKSTQIRDFSDLPQPVLDKFLKVCELAFQGISSTEREVIFADLPEQFDSLGLMQSVPELYIDQGTTVSHNFLHLTIQEYLAAYHLSLLSEEDQLTFLEENLEEQTTVSKFFAGLSHHNVSLVCKALQLNQDSTEEIPELSVSAIHVLFELQEQDSISKVLGSQPVKFSGENDEVVLSSYDYYVLGYCIGCSQCSWDISLLYYSVECIEMLSKGMTTFQHETDQSTGPGPGVTHLRLGLMLGLSELLLDAIFAESPTILKQVKGSAGPCPCFQRLILPLGESESDLSAKREVGYHRLAESMHLFPNLQHLEISKCDGVGHEGAVFKYLPNSVSSLNLLLFNYDVQPEILYDNYYEDLRDLLRSPSHSIEHLDVTSFRSLTPICVQHIIDGLSQNTSIKNFQLQVIDSLHPLVNKFGFTTTHHVQVDAVTSILFSLLKVLRENTTLASLAIAVQFSIIDSTGDESSLEFAVKKAEPDSEIEGPSQLKNRLMVDLSLSCILQFQDIDLIAQALESNSLQSLRLSHNSIGAKEAVSLARALEHSSTLRSLSLSHNFVCDEGTTALAKALECNRSLEIHSLDLSDNSVREEGAAALARVLKGCSTIQSLDLSRNLVRVQGSAALARALEHNSTLQSLDLSRNSIRDRGATALAKALENNSTLQSLDISYNSIRDRGAAAIAKALENNSILESLNLSDNSVGDEGATALAKALKKNSTLRSLDISDNTYGDEGKAALDEMLKTNPVLKVKFRKNHGRCCCSGSTVQRESATDSREA